MTELMTPSTGLAASSADARYGLILAQFAALAEQLRALSEHVQDSHAYIEGCSAGVDRLADQMAKLKVDSSTVAEHREAAALMRSALSEAAAMASAAEDLSTRFTQVADGHRAEYGSVVEAQRAMPVSMAAASFYANR